MRNINEISFYELIETMKTIDAMATEDIIRLVCEKCRLAGELDIQIKEINENDCVEIYQKAVELHKAIVAIWFLLNDCKPSNTTIH